MSHKAEEFWGISFDSIDMSSMGKSASATSNPESEWSTSSSSEYTHRSTSQTALGAILQGADILEYERIEADILLASIFMARQEETKEQSIQNMINIDKTIRRRMLFKQMLHQERPGMKPKNSFQFQHPTPATRLDASKSCRCLGSDSACILFESICFILSIVLLLKLFISSLISGANDDLLPVAIIASILYIISIVMVYRRGRRTLPV